MSQAINISSEGLYSAASVEAPDLRGSGLLDEKMKNLSAPTIIAAAVAEARADSTALTGRSVVPSPADTDSLLAEIFQDSKASPLVRESVPEQAPSAIMQAISDINTNMPHLSDEKKDIELSSRFNKIVNPSKDDGQCFSCMLIVNSHLMQNEALALEASEPVSRFSDPSFTGPMYGKVTNNVSATIEREENETFSDLRSRVASEIKQLTKSGDAVLISISDSHWFNAYNDGERVWFIDSQTGRGFNLYTDIDEFSDGDEINIILGAISI